MWQLSISWTISVQATLICIQRETQQNLQRSLLSSTKQSRPNVGQTFCQRLRRWQNVWPTLCWRVAHWDIFVSSQTATCIIWPKIHKLCPPRSRVRQARERTASYYLSHHGASETTGAPALWNQKTFPGCWSSTEEQAISSSILGWTNNFI